MRTFLIGVVSGALALSLSAQNVRTASLTEISALPRVLNFEDQHGVGAPAGWTSSPEATVSTDDKIVHGGQWAARLERKADSPGRFSNIHRAVAMDFAGKTVELRGFLRLEDVTGYAGFWIREDGEGSSVAFDNMQSRQLKGTSGWTEYSVTLPVHAEGRQLFFGVLLVGTGRVWADDLQLLVDGKPVWDAPKAVHEKTSAELDREGPAPAVVVDWVREHAIAIKTPEAGHGFDDLQPLKKIVGDARLVALGEATHGTREFFQLKHRMLEFLVQEMDFNIFGIEATMPEGFDVNEYVLTGKGDPGKALAGLYFWTWNTEEVLRMIEWMRQYNADPRHTKKVKFYGFDMQSTVRAAKVTLAFLRKVNPQEAQKAESTLLALYDPFNLVRNAPKSKQDALAAGVKEILQDLDQQKEVAVQRSSEQEWAQARQFIRILQQNLELIGGGASRDKSMAENIGWILDHEAPGSKMVIWAHNGHVAKGPSSTSMGSYLFKSLGQQMVVFGFAFNQGSFQAVEYPPETFRGRHPFTVGPTSPGGLDATLSAAGKPLAALDLRTLPADGPVHAWFQHSHLVRMIGAVYTPPTPEQFIVAQVITQRYDALLFVDNTSAAHAVIAGYPHPVLAAPSNLDFEAETSGGAPELWLSRPESAQFDYHVKLTAGNPHGGRRCLEISRDLTRHYGESPGGVSQTIDATGFRGKRIRLRGWVRGELRGPLSSAHLRLTVGTGEDLEPKSFDAMADKPPVTSKWQLYEVIAEVPNDAVTISYGIAMMGDGRIWLDDVSLENVAAPEAGSGKELH
jgi:erythromycin esterase